MIRIKYIIPKKDLFNWIENPEIIKVLLIGKRNLKLENDFLCEIFAFHYIDFSTVATIIGSCKRVADEDGRYEILSSEDLSFLRGIQSLKGNGYLTKSIIIKLIEIEKKYDVNLSISNKVIDLIEKNK